MFLVCFNIVDRMIQILLQCHYVFISFKCTLDALPLTYGVVAVGFCVVLSGFYRLFSKCGKCVAQLMKMFS